MAGGCRPSVRREMASASIPVRRFMIVPFEIGDHNSIDVVIHRHNTRQPAGKSKRPSPKRRRTMAARKSSGRRKYGKAASKRVESAMRRRKKGTLKSGRSGRTVKSRKQAIAIGLAEARKKGAKVPRKRTGRKSSSGRKRSR
ncbi:MAG: DUF6496 domain-containing protein [Gemmatimonadaceae bacterium]